MNFGLFKKRFAESAPGASGRKSSAAYRHHEGHYLIELNLREARQLFNSLDPAPFREKDLDAAAEEYLVSAVRELGLRHRSRLIVHLPADGFNGESAESIVTALRHYFEYRTHHASDELRQALNRGAISFLIGIVFLFACLWLRQQVAGQILLEGLLIMGWVAMWRPIEVFLYDWWPLLHRRRIFTHIATMPIDIQQLRS